MARYRIQIRDPDTGYLVHEVTHLVFGTGWYEALREFAQVYGFKIGQWRLRAVEVKEPSLPCG